MLEKTPESPLGSKEINPVNLNGNYFFWRVNTSCYYKGTRKNKKQLLFFLVFRFMQALEHKCFFQQCHVISLSHRSIIWLQKVKVKVTMSCVQLLWPCGLYTVHGILQARILEWVAFPFSRGIFPTQGLNPGLVHCRWILSQLSHKGSPRILNWVAYPFSSRFSWPRNWTRVSCIAGGFFTNWATRTSEKLHFFLAHFSNHDMHASFMFNDILVSKDHQRMCCRSLKRIPSTLFFSSSLSYSKKIQCQGYSLYFWG